MLIGMLLTVVSVMDTTVFYCVGYTFGVFKN
jgi:hypothetical protein